MGSVHVHKRACMRCGSWGFETSEEADEEPHWSLNTRPPPQATKQRICPCCFQTQACHLPSGRQGWRYFCGGLCVSARRWVSVCCQKTSVLGGRNFWKRVFFVLEIICWLVMLPPNSSLITIKVIPGRPQKANCCVCMLQPNCCGPGLY